MMRHPLRACTLTLSMVFLVLTLATVPGWAKGPGTVEFDQLSYVVVEEAGLAIVTVERSGGEDGPVSVSYATGGGTATPDEDFTPTSGELSWLNGDGSTKTFVVPILDDGLAEGGETIELILSNPSGGATIEPGHAQATLTILASDGGTGGGGNNGGDDNGGDDNGGDDDGGDDSGGDDNGGDDPDSGAGQIKFDQKNFEVLEQSGVAVITVERSRGETGAVSVSYGTINGSALAGSDYTEVSGTLSWGDGDDSTQTFTVPILEDSEAEGSERFQVVLSAPTGGATLATGRDTAQVTILDNENGGDDGADDRNKPGVLKFGERRFQTVEGDTMAVITVERSKGQLGPVSVRYSTGDGTATPGSDYSPVSGTLSWASGDSRTKTFEVPVFEDSESEGNEMVELELSSPTGGASLDPERGESELVILDTDGSTDSCVADDSKLCLLGGRFEVEVTWRTQQGDSGSGTMVPVSDSSGLVWFFDASNIEMLVKLVNACGLPGFDDFWIFFAATTNVDFTLRVTDTGSGLVKEYSNPLGQAAEPIQDTFTFQTCP